MAKTDYDIIVAGGGHAGVEAAAAAARIGAHTLLVSMRLDEICRMSCNPAIGGLGKGHLVREVDALSGLMGRATDATGLQYRMLNMAKGPAVRAPRAQADKVDYPRWMQRALREEYPQLDLLDAEVAAVLTEEPGPRVTGLELADGSRIRCRALVLTAGTFLDGLIHLGPEQTRGGRWDAPAAYGLTASLRALGLETLRLKTGTPARLHRDSIDWAILEAQPGDDPPPPFSFMTEAINRPQVHCHITYTSPETHDIIRRDIDRSPLFSGRIQGTGPRYCPSIEDKVHRFPDRDRHQIFLEPESLHTPLIYPNGISTSMPRETQEAFLRSIPGLRDVEIVRFGYAIEYVAFPPTQLSASLETRAVQGLYLAGQLNGTTGYEEAAALGLYAGANAALRLHDDAPLFFRRDEAYLGVMIDDLITKGAPEPYRMFTSRSEHRLLLRQDNADLRLTPAGRRAGLVDDARWKRFEAYHDGIAAQQQRLGEQRLRPHDFEHPALREAGLQPPAEAVSLQRLLTRPDCNLALLEAAGLYDPGDQLPPGILGRRVREHVEIQARYAGYIDRQQRQVQRQSGVETLRLPGDIAYPGIPSLRSEAAQVLSHSRPQTLGQASRLPGVNPADITAILIHLRARQGQATV